MKFSILLPVKDGGEYVKECVDSILSQTLQDFNLIVLDNCSTDGTLEWLQSQNDARIVIHPSGKQLSIEENWVRIKSIPKNEFITLIGHDDILNKNYLEVMANLIQKHPAASLYQSHYHYIDGGGKILRNCLPMDEVQQAHEFLALYMCNLIESTGTGYMMRSKDYDNFGGINPGYDNLIFADFALWIDLMGLSYKATSFDITFKYRIHNSVSKVTNGEAYQQAFDKFLEFIIEKGSKSEKIKLVSERYGKKFLLYFCEALSHRVLKTPRVQRQVTVRNLIEKYKNYAARLVPGQDFEPGKKFRIKIAKVLDSSAIGRELFLFLKKF
jgi:glycosyltransferase involved in cell wall biosynthesis